jgi:thiol-disulfide isomerase/thioredoxin
MTNSAPAAGTTNTEAMDEAEMAAGDEEMMGDEEMAADEEMAEDAMTGDDTMAEHEEMADEGMADDQEMMADTDMSGNDEMMGDDEMMGEDEMAGEDMSSTLPAWQQIPLVDARTGETFTLADFAGKTVFVEPMATWCSNCRRQLQNVREAKRQFSGDDVVFFALSVETSLSAETLAQYSAAEGFDWTFAVLTPEMLQQLVDQFGRAIGNPPSTPHFVIRADGTTTDLITGIDPPETIVALLQANQG